MLSRLIISVFALTSFSACTMAPLYKRPSMPVPAYWPEGAAYKNVQSKDQINKQTLADLEWRKFFTDLYLQQLIEIALKNNRDLRVATLNIEKAQASYRVQRADLLPSVNAVGGGSIQSTKDVGGNNRISREYSLKGVSSYELDVFGRVKSLKNQAQADYYATAAAQRSVKISLIAEVANTYLTLLADNESLRLARETLSAQENSYQLTKKSVDAGVRSLIDLSQARTTVEAARADVAVYTGNVASDENALMVLLGGSIPEDVPKSVRLDQITLLSDLPAGMPSDLLQRRPDIIEAEYKLQAANANIGAARAAFFPLINLTAGIGRASSDLSTLFKAGTSIWSFVPQITLPIFEAGKNIANLDIAHITKNINIAQYEKAIQVAFKEVAVALAQRGQLLDQLDAEQAYTAAAEKTYSLSELRYRHGIDSYLNLLDAQRSLYSAQQRLITTQLAQLSNLVMLYKAVGGGWERDLQASV